MLPDLFDAYQQGLIADIQAKLKTARGETVRTEEHLQSETQRLEAKIDGLALICQALIEILRDSGGVAESTIEDRIREIDLRDGRADGRIAGSPTECSRCSRPAHTRQRVCMYCGTRIESGMLVEKPFGQR
jgi:hypothetical protein